MIKVTHKRSYVLDELVGIRIFGLEDESNERLAEVFAEAFADELKADHPGEDVAVEVVSDDMWEQLVGAGEF